MSGFVRKCPGGHYDMIQSTKKDETLWDRCLQGLFAEVCHGHCSYLLLLKPCCRSLQGFLSLVTGRRRDAKKTKTPVSSPRMSQVNG